jgi:O-antigen/teichoic acid export membrane protein
MSLSLFFSLLLGVVAFTPLYGLVMGGVYNLSPGLQEVARPATQLMVLYPLLMGAQSVLRGVLIRGGCTGAVRTAMTAHVVALLGTVVAGVVFLPYSGAVVAAIAVMVGAVVELAWLYWRRRC